MAKTTKRRRTERKRLGLMDEGIYDETNESMYLQLTKLLSVKRWSE